jgi:hypothetical protein
MLYYGNDSFYFALLSTLTLLITLLAQCLTLPPEQNGLYECDPHIPHHPDNILMLNSRTVKNSHKFRCLQNFRNAFESCLLN